MSAIAQPAAAASSVKVKRPSGWDQLKTLILEPAASWQDGFQATVLAIKANEAVNSKQRVVLEKEFFDI